MPEPSNMYPPIGSDANGNALKLFSSPGINAMDSREGQDADQPQNAGPQPGSRPVPLPLADTMRAYRACLNCRNRKSRCDLDPNGGKPPCRRCTREGKECVLGESHRGGRRVRKKPKLEDGSPSSATSSQPAPFQSPTMHDQHYGPSNQNNQHNLNNQHSQQLPQKYPPIYDRGFSWQQQTPANPLTADTNISQHTEHPNITSQSNEPQYRERQESTMSLFHSSEPGQQAAIRQGLAPADLQNPSDALEILAQVADRAEDGDSEPNDQQGVYHQKQFRHMDHRQDTTSPKMPDYFAYQPAQDGMISPEMIYQYFSSYEQFFHPYFPIIPRETFDRTRLPWLSQHEPHLFSAILTISSKDDERVHKVCYDHMQGLIMMAMAGADADVDAVEALLLLSQWVSHRPQASTSLGRGEEDRVAWMYIGMALRLGYLLEIEQTAFRSDANDDPRYNRKRLVWLACYICDRQVSVRVGKGFWSRGPGPLSGLRASDFHTLQPQRQGEDDYAMIFQANLELTQIFSNVHDILYSSKHNGWKDMLKGRYAKYLDDFRSSIIGWNECWGSLACSPQLKASLDLTYNYLRLYVNAFAYQATISRALIFQRDGQHKPDRSIPLINSSAPDARFIYEALNAAKALLDTFNTSVDPQTLRYMPVSYYLFVVYSAVFLYKARLTTTMSQEERSEVPEMISQTIDRLERASIDKSHMGSRYARLLRLLWRKSPPRPSPRPTPLRTLDGGLMTSQHANNTPGSQFEQNHFSHMQNSSSHPSQSQPHSHLYPPPPPQQASLPNNAFSWLDLSATWNFATQNNSASGGEIDDPLIDPELSRDMGLGMLPDYSFLEGDNTNFIF